MLTFSCRKTCLNAVAFSPDGARLAAGGSGGRIRVWTLNPPAEERTLTFPGEGMVRDLAFDADGVSILARDDHKLRAAAPTSAGSPPRRRGRRSPSPSRAPSWCTG
ncbi:MAG: WD40 repeat domain-containing protein [Gemmataceae bacterium]